MIELPQMRISFRGRQWQVDSNHVHDLSIPLDFDQPQPNFFGAPLATSHALTAGTFVGDIRTGGSCNCSTYTLTPHCNGTHTECVGHVTRDRIGVSDIPSPAYSVARVVTISPTDVAHTDETTEPVPQRGDRMITKSALVAAFEDAYLKDVSALIVRTTPNSPSKRAASYGPAQPPPYFSADAMRWIVEIGIQQLVVDLPSVDRAADEGRLTSHRIFWGLPVGATDAVHAMRGHATITELAYIDDSIIDGIYLLNLQIAPFVADAAPSRPLLLPLRAA